MSHIPEYAVAVIGAGPRGTSFLERLLAHCEGQATPSGLIVHLIDPAPHGCGKVWDPQQSPLYLMNTPAAYPTAAPTGRTQNELPASSCSFSFSQWAQQQGLAIADTEFPRRRDYGRYLQDLLSTVIRRFRELGVQVQQHHHHAMRIQSPTRTGRPQKVAEKYLITLETGKQISADTAVLALGHLPAALDRPSATFAGQAQAAGIHYLPPAVPTDVDYEQFPAGETLLVRGMGLNFFDLMIQLTQGRGGIFEDVPQAAPGQRLRYTPSGREPHLVAGSRRGTPYRSKTTAAGFVPAGITLTHFSDQAIQALLDDAEDLNDYGQLSFGDHLWPLIEADIERTHAEFAGSIDHDPARTAAAQVTRNPEIIHDEEHPRFDVRSYAHPFEGREFTNTAAYQKELLDWLVSDAAASAAGAASAEKMAINAMHAARLAMKPLITAGHVDPISHITQVEGWFESLVEGLTSGPPLQRIEELAALARAGVVEFLGPNPVFTVDDEARCFTASSPQVHSDPVRSRWLIDAMMPPNRIVQADSPLVHQLFEDALSRPAANRSTAGAGFGKGFDVTAQPHRLIPGDRQETGAGRRPLADGSSSSTSGADTVAGTDAGTGAVTESNEAETAAGSIHVLGLQLSSVQWGTAIAAEAGGDPRSTARTLADAHAAASEVVRCAEARLRPV